MSVRNIPGSGNGTSSFRFVGSKIVVEGLPLEDHSALSLHRVKGGEARHFCNLGSENRWIVSKLFFYGTLCSFPFNKQILLPQHP